MTRLSEQLKSKIINGIIDIEGGYVDNKDDSGGATNFGITEYVARVNGYDGDMKDMPKSVAFDIYTKQYWHKVMAGAIAKLSEMIAEEVVDTGINMGTSRAVLFLQRSLNVLNKAGVLYDDLETDGRMGLKTIASLEAYLAVRDESVMLKMLNSLQGAFYVELSERREKDEAFIYGWFRNRV